MPHSKSVDDIISAIKELDQEERENLARQIAKIDELMEDIEDIIDLVRSKNEDRIPYDDFLAELRAEGR